MHQLDHDYAADLTTAYGDPFCLMSAANNTGSFVQPDTNLNYVPAIATVVVPDTVAGTASVTEPRGNTEFTVQRIDTPGRTIHVTARKL